jgi:hypothetical protein
MGFAAAAEAERGKFGSVEDALVVVPRMRSAFGDEGATFDQLFDAHFAHSPVHSEHFRQTPRERAALDYLYADILQLFERKHGRIEEQYWCTQLPAAALRTDGHDPEFWAIVDWQQEDAPFVEQMFALDELELGNRYLKAQEDRKTLRRLIFDAYSSALDGLENRRLRNLTDQKTELDLVKDQVKLAQRFYKSVAQRRAQTETLRGMAVGVSVAVSLVAIGLAFVSVSGIGVPVSSLLLTWALAGTAGAFLSVLIRVAREDFTPNWEASDDELHVTGALRPFVGAALGIGIPVVLISGLQGADVSLPGDSLKSWYFYVGLALLAGVSERWAQDLISKQPSVIGSLGKDQKENQDT